MLQVLLDRLQRDFHRTDYLASDPLEFVHRFTDPWDREAVALVAALLAYGNVKQIRRSVAAALLRMEATSGSPQAFVRMLGTDAGLQKGSEAFAGFVHRFNREDDLVTLFWLLGKSWEAHGSLGAHFLSYLEPAAPTFSDALDALVHEWRAWAATRSPADSFYYLLTAPKDGSCCKRWCMFLRWMGRSDAIDPGLWAVESGGLTATFPEGRRLRANQLVIPIDTHTGRISQYLGLTSRKSLNWKAALDVTRSLRRANPDDPVRYDFALARLGILDLCQRRYKREVCEKCQLFGACRYAKRRAPRGKKS